LEGDRKQVTVLFADLKGSMELLADRDPEEARALLDPVLERMMEAVHRYEGTVNQVMGDGVMALYRRREFPDFSHPPPRQLPPGIPAQLGQQDILSQENRSACRYSAIYTQDAPIDLTI
jgi:class 3 adenylate cyclase